MNQVIPQIKIVYTSSSSEEHQVNVNKKIKLIAEEVSKDSAVCSISNITHKVNVTSNGYKSYTTFIEYIIQQ